MICSVGIVLLAWKMLLSGALFVAHGLIIFRRWNDELKELPKFLIIFTAAVIELLIENYCVWYAQDEAALGPAHSATTPLGLYVHMRNCPCKHAG